jgi:molybdopterin molybdotransferase
MRRFGRLTPLETALQQVLTAVHPARGSESVALARALGRVSATRVVAPRNVPAFRRATWDGYAVRSADTKTATPGAPRTLRLVGEVFAEGHFHRRIGPGEAVAVATGGAVPPGADGVIIFEDVTEAPTHITLRRPVPPGDRIAAPGADFPRGALLVEKGAVLDAARLGAVGATGAARIRVHRRPRVALIANGNELRRVGTAYRPGAIYEINNLTLGALVESAGGAPVPRPSLPDDPRRIETAIRSALHAYDMVIVTGGSSVGERDFLPSVFQRLGRVLFHGIAVRPGKPTLAATVGGKVLLGMPGHPTSCLTNGFWLLVPAVRKLAGLPGPGARAETVTLIAEAPVPSADLTTIVPLHIEAGQARPTFRDSSAITSLVGANAYAVLPPGSPRPGFGSSITAFRLDPFLAAG